MQLNNTEPETEAEEKILDDTLVQIVKALTAAQPLPEGALTVEVGRDATVYSRCSFTGTTLDELKDRMGKYGLRDDDLSPLGHWEEAGSNAFDDVEIYRVYDHTGELIFEYAR